MNKPPISLAERRKAEPTLQEQVIEGLEKMLDHARKGDVDTVLVIAKRPDGLWQFVTAGNAFTTEMVGRLEIIKHDMIVKYIEDETQ